MERVSLEQSQSEEFILLRQRVDEQQRSIDDMTRQLNIISTAFNDITSVEKEHESHTLLAKHTLNIEEDTAEMGPCMRFCYCFFCK